MKIKKFAKFYIKRKRFLPASGSELARGCQDTHLCLGHGPPNTIAEGHGPATCSGCAPRHLDLKNYIYE